jgi:hypothetical protein
MGGAGSYKKSSKVTMGIYRVFFGARLVDFSFLFRKGKREKGGNIKKKKKLTDGKFKIK